MVYLRAFLLVGFALVISAPAMGQFKKDDKGATKKPAIDPTEGRPDPDAPEKKAPSKPAEKGSSKPSGKSPSKSNDKSSDADRPEATAPAGGIQLDKETVQRIKIGIVVTAGSGPCSGMYGTAPIPFDWPEQTVRVVDEQVTDNVKKIEYRVVEGGVKQMVARIPTLKAGETAKALVILEVKRKTILAPEQTSAFLVPVKAKIDADARLRGFIRPSPKIESTDKRIVEAAKEAIGEKSGGWEKVESIYDWVRTTIEYRNGELKGALAALKDGTGDCEEMSSLFIALCRANGIPARTVWVPGHCYPEFYLVDESGTGHWFPCQAAGARAFGGIPETRPIMQKGDAFTDKDRPSQKMRYMSEHFTCKIVKGSPPTVKFIRQNVNDEALDDTRPDVPAKTN